MERTEISWSAIEEYRPKILRYLARLVGPDEAEDLTQEVFLKISRTQAGFRGGAKLSTWIYRIATNTALDRLRKRANEQPGMTDEQLVAADQSAWSGGRVVPVDQQAMNNEMNFCIRKVIDSLPLNYRTVLTLGELENLKAREVAEVLGISVENVKIRLHRARVHLKNELEAGCSFYQTPDQNVACAPERKP
ncbi:MAG: RNA polymerase sigma factor [Spirochaetia bacterium]